MSFLHPAGGDQRRSPPIDREVVRYIISCGMKCAVRRGMEREVTMPKQQLGGERVKYIGASQVPAYYLLCQDASGAWGTEILDDTDSIVRRFGPFGRRGEAIQAAE